MMRWDFLPITQILNIKFCFDPIHKFSDVLFVIPKSSWTPVNHKMLTQHMPGICGNNQLCQVYSGNTAFIASGKLLYSLHNIVPPSKVQIVNQQLMWEVYPWRYLGVAVGTIALDFRFHIDLLLNSKIFCGSWCHSRSSVSHSFWISTLQIDVLNHSE